MRCIRSTGATGTGKSIIVKDLFLNQLNKEQFMPIFLQFSAQTTANQTQDIIEQKLEKRRKGVCRCVVCLLTFAHLGKRIVHNGEGRMCGCEGS